MLLERSQRLPAVPAGQGPGLSALACRALARVGFAGSGRLSILIFHRVLPQPDPLFPDEMHAARFDAQLGQLKHSFNFMSLGEGVRGLRSGKLPPRAACITFDDGYADNAEVALPILHKHGLPATVFVATGFLDGGRMWNDTVIELIRRAPDAIDLGPHGYGRFALGTVAERRAAIASLLNTLKYLPLAARLDAVDAVRALVPAALPENLMMTSSQVRQLHQAGIEIGGHTVNHPILARMDDAGARREMADGKDALEGLIGAPVRLFAYPNGKPGQDYLSRHAAMAREVGFEAAVSTSWGAARPGGDLFQLPRFTPWDRKPLRFMLRMVQNARRNGDTV
ncbi:polysaccharide deacetylase family protein [Massilia cavernae]|uniref:Polysaccharide deacetylase family protein n=1 Tax=Massilia cavernae TaxID=2320864 RepID=A0A418XU99_9BURK|nr:polysaccharide deacetylase family protein [Massilia cavernae]RJG16275.1 polysaccharide deacetylase family protein [Massilia cavernae]